MEERVNIRVLKQMIIDRGQTVSEIAKTSGMSPVTLYEILRSGKIKSFPTVVKLCTGLNVGLDEISKEVK